MDNRKLDSKNTEIINDWLTNYIYTDVEFENVVRYDDLEHQYAGVDITFNIGDVEYVCDEKASTYRMNGFQGTFAMCVSQINKDNVRRDDWFINDTLDTDSYMLVWIDKADCTPKTLTYNAIREVTCALVRKRNIEDYLVSKNWDRDRINKMKDYMVENCIPSWGNINKHGLKWTYDLDKYREKSINIVIPRDVLIKISDWNKTIKV